MLRFEHLSPGTSALHLAWETPDGIRKLLPDINEMSGKDGALLITSELRIQLRYAIETTEVVSLEIWKWGELAHANICCFNGQDEEKLLDIVRRLYATLELGVPAAPRAANWMHTIPILPAVLDERERVLAHKVAIAIYCGMAQEANCKIEFYDGGMN